MKKIITIITILSIFFSFFLNAQENSENFYYNGDEKIFLQPKMDKLFLQFKPNANIENLTELINREVSLQPTSDVNLEELHIYGFVVLETNDERRISSATIESYKTKAEIVSATHIFQCNRGTLNGLMNEFIVKLKETASYEQLQKLAEQNNCKIVEEKRFSNDYKLTVSKFSTLNAMQMANLFYETKLFEYSVPNFTVLNALYYDQYFEHQWGLKNTGQNGGNAGVDINVEQAWTITQGSPNIRVAVIDNGVDLTHPDLQANLLPGQDFTGQNSEGAPLAKNDNHGTACAGIIGAIKDNDIGICGVAPNCRIIPIRAGTGLTLNKDWVTNAINWAWQNGADVISCSWGGMPDYIPLTIALTQAAIYGREEKGCVVVFASGNEGKSTVVYPASFPTTISVGAINRYGQRDSNSNYGNDLNVVAPGVSIYTTDRQGSAGYSDNDYYCCFNLTSAATPYVAGVAALVLSVNPCLTQLEVRKIIESSCDKIGGCIYNNLSTRPHGTWNNKTGYGLVNAYRAVQYAYGMEPTTFTDISGIDQGASASFKWAIVNAGCSGFSTNIDMAKRHEIKTTIYYPYTPSPMVWGSSNGFSAASPNEGNYYMNVLSVSETSATIRTWVYEMNGYWIPTSPANVRFNVSVASDLSNNLFLQNKTITNNVGYNAINRITAGKNVTSGTTGNYTVQSGANVTFRAGNSIILSDGFVASSGSNFRAYIEPFFTCTHFALRSAIEDCDADEKQVPMIESYGVEKTDYPESEAQIEEHNFYLKLYPNPSAGNVTIEYNINKSEFVEISLHDSHGRLVYKLKNNSTHDSGVYKVTLNGTELPAGIYFCTLQTENRHKTERLLIVK